MKHANARMSAGHGIEIVTMGHAYPDEIVDNDAFFRRATWPEPSAREALEAETGVRSRRWCRADESALSLATRALAATFAGKESLKDEIDVVLVTSSTTTAVLRPADPAEPGSGDFAPLILRALGRTKILGLDLKSCNCTGFLRALEVADALLANPNHRAALVLSVERTSSFATSPNNRSAFTFIFADAAGAAVVRKTPRRARSGLVDYVGHIDVDHFDCLRFTPDGLHIASRGSSLKDAAIAQMIDCGRELLERNDLTAENVTWLVPVQTSAGVVSPVAEALGFPRSKVLWSADTLGFSGSASIPAALSEGLARGTIRRGDLVLSVAVGAGLNAAGALLYV